ncbi:hypothetical protein pW4_73 [Bacillus phage pW4]|uniref:Uncharacterized protein n=1 Tax=Bacillus phage pW4 TaxID=2500560 RepID=A0A3Q9R7U8_9CAUD|nr:hypothetical protein PP656_gp066 [Bacillus phage pW4]AZU99088.1 hypothetical protein pW4_73 [Bacillus phage pW4]
MELIEILKGARKRIESAEHLADGIYKEDNIMYGECFCALGHVFNEMQLEQFDFDRVEGMCFEDLNLETDIDGKLSSLKPLAIEMQELQNTNDQSFCKDRKTKVLNKLDEIIEKVEVLQNGNPSN